MQDITFEVTRFPAGYKAEGQNLPAQASSESWKWDDLVRERLAHEPIEGKKGFVPQLFLGTYKPDAKDKRAHSVASVCALGLDCDDISYDELLTVVEALSTEGLAFVGTPTYSHDPKADEDTGKWRYRFYVPLDEPVGSPEEFEFLWTSFCSKLRLGKLLDPESRHISKAYVEPACAPGTDYGNWEDHVLQLDGNPVVVSDYVSPEAVERLKAAMAAEQALRDREFAPFDPADLIPLTKLRASKKNADWLEPFRQAMKGEPYAGSGSREVTLRAIAWALAMRFPEADPRELAEPFRVSVEKTAGFNPDGDDAGVTFDDFVAKLNTAQLKFLQEKEVKKAEHVASKKEERELAEGLAEHFERLKERHEQGPDFLNSHELLIRDKSTGHLYYFDVLSGGYSFCFSVPVVMQMVRVMAPFWSREFGFQLYNPGSGTDDDGNPKPLTFDDEKSFELLLKEYGTVCDGVEFRTYGFGYFDRKRKVIVRNEVRDPCERWHPDDIQAVERLGRLALSRDKELREALASVTTNEGKAAVMSKYVQKWEDSDAPGEPDFRYLREALRRSFANGTSDLEAFEMYLSRVRDTRFPSKILTLLGRAASGKDALLKITARAIGGFSSGEKCLGRFGVGIEASRVWMFSEDLPRDRFGNVLTQRLREVVTLQEHNLEMKGQQRAIKLYGYPRLMASLQDSSKLNFGEGAHSRDDIEALNERFLILQFNRNARETLHRGFWEVVEKHKLMEAYIHYAERCVQRVALQDPNAQHDRFGFLRSENSTALTDGPSVALLEMVWRLLEASVMQADHVSRFSGSTRIGSKPPVFVNKGDVYISPNIIYDNWDTYAPPDRPKPKNLRLLLQTVQAVAEREKYIRIRLGVDRPRYYVLNRELLRVQAHLLSEPERFDWRLAISDNLDFRDRRFQLTELELARNHEHLVKMNPRVKTGNLSLA